MGRLILDLRFALRNLRRTPIFTAVAVASLALGIGANTAIFTLIDQLMLRLLPVTDPGQLVMIWTTGPHIGNNRGSREGVHRQVFVPGFQSAFPSSASFYIRTAVDSASLFTAVRRQVTALDPAIPVYDLKTLVNQFDDTLSTERMIAALSAAFGVLATALAAMGLYGAMAFVVARRTNEIGLPMAPGAARGAVVWMVVREALVLVGAGLAVGVPCAYLLSRYVASQLFGVLPTDGGAVLLALAILGAAATGASLLPPRRASTIDPIQALRYE